ncbi:MAG: 3,4-dihydroxy-2-butanone-4-phosphate synthase [Zetaproteobacteria bacterium]|nr:MAG: 3,4-dihydroxy-2-butanone-4-phosphate synthase [Zetaproteobacteria bacterium]
MSNKATISKQDVHDARLGTEDQSILSSIDEIIEDMRNGKPVIIVDDEDRENEGDLVIAAQMATPENINFMAKDGRGLICLPMEDAMVDRLGLQLMGRGNNTQHRTAFTVSIEAKEGVTTGISAADRAKTIQTAINPNNGPETIATPGHVFPLVAREGGVLVRAGHTEAAVDLAKMAGFGGAGVICEIMNDDGTMARLDDLVGFAQLHNLKIGTIADLIAHRRRNEKLVKCIHETVLSSRYGGDFNLYIYAVQIEYAEHIALVKGDISNTDEPVLVRMHAMNILGDVLGADGDSVLQKSMELIEEEGRGVIVLLRSPSATSLSDRLLMKQSDTKTKKNGKVLRDYGIGAQILLDLGVRNMVLLSNSPKSVIGLDGYDLHIQGHRTIS